MRLAAALLLPVLAVTTTAASATAASAAPAAPAAPASGALSAGAATGVVAALAPQSSTIPLSRGHEGVCTSSRGVSVVVDFRELGGTTLRRCAMPLPGKTAFAGTGLDALRAANVKVEGTDRWGLAFVCRLQGKPSATTELTVGGQSYREACVTTPPSAAHWSYWYSTTRSGSWTYSAYGADNRQAVNGGYEGWSFSLNRTAAAAPRIVPGPAPTGALAPFSAATPTITGTAAVGSTLKASRGTWSPTPETVSYRWHRDGLPISGAYYSSYKVTTADQGHQLTVMVTGSGAGRAKTWSTARSLAVPAAG